MTLNELELHYDCEIKFGQVINCKVHRPSGGSNLALSHCGGTKKEREASNLHGFSKIEHYHKKGSLSFTFHEGSIRHGGRT
jgi:hypothetical protein